jgi:hypothetical protein
VLLEFSSTLWNLKVHYHIHNSSPLVPVPSQANPVHTNPSYLFQDLPTYISIFLVVSFPPTFLPITYTQSSSPPFMLHDPIHPIIVDLIILIIFGEQIMKLLVMNSCSPHSNKITIISYLVNRLNIYATSKEAKEKELNITITQYFFL